PNNMLSRLSAALLGAAFFCPALPVAQRDSVAPNAPLGAARRCASSCALTLQLGARRPTYAIAWQ
ncbi:hypothetical protein NMT55_25050, partial [Escherichia coli]|nr:hypothetical protein [Escherichia coli]